MTLQELGNIGEFIAAVATLATLVYLAAQIRHDTRSVRASSFQTSARDAFEIVDQIALDLEPNRIYFSGTRDYESLTPGGQRRFGTYMSSLLGRGESLEFRSAQGIVDRQGFSFFEANSSVAFAQPGTWQGWEKARHPFHRAFKGSSSATSEGGALQTPPADRALQPPPRSPVQSIHDTIGQ